MACVFNVVTDGVPPRGGPRRFDDIRVLQINWIINDEITVVTLRHPDLVVVPSPYHSLTQAIVDTEGLPPAVALTAFLEAISSVDQIVAFNDFHADALRAELRRHLPNASLPDVVTLQRRWMSLAEMVGRPVKTPLEKLLATQQLYPIPSQRRIPRLSFSGESVVQ